MTCFAPLGADPLASLPEEMDLPPLVGPGVRGPLNPCMPEFGAIANGFTDDAARLQACYAALVALGGGVLELTEPHAMGSALEVTTDNIEIVFRGRGRLTGRGATVIEGLIWAHGTWQALDLALAQDAARGDVVLHLTQAPDLAEGDILDIIATVQFAGVGYAYNHGFEVMVARVTGSAVTLAWALPFPLKTTDTISVRKEIPLRRFRLERLRADKGAAAGATVRGLLVQRAKGAVIDGAETSGFAAAGMMFGNLYGGRIGGLASEGDGGSEFAIVFSRLTRVHFAGVAAERSAYGGIFAAYCHHNTGGGFAAGAATTRGIELYASSFNNWALGSSNPGFDNISIQQNSCGNVLTLVATGAQSGTSDRRGVKDNGEHNDGNRIVYVSRGNLDGDTINNGYSTGNATLPAA